MQLLSYLFGMTVNEWVGKYLSIIDSSDLSDRTKQARHIYARIFCHHFGKRRLKSLKRLELREMYLTEREHAPHRGRALLMFVKLCLKEAVIEGLIDSNPADHIKTSRPPVVRRRLGVETFWQIYNRAPENHYFRVAMALAIITAQRRSDLVKMRFDDVVDGYLHIRQVKTGAKVALPLTLKSPLFDISLGELVKQCKRRNTKGFAYLLQNERGNPVKGESLSTWFADCRGTRNKGDPSFHELRSLAERLYRMDGLDTQTLLGHKNQSQTDEYNDLRDDGYKKLVL